MSLTILRKLSKTLLLLAISCLVFSDIYAQREDIVIMQNGDNITGEIKRLELGILVFKTDDIETINIKWDKVESVQTKNIYEIELQDGRFTNN